MVRCWVFSALVWLGATSANAVECPKILAAIADTALNAPLIPKTKSLYEKLGCEFNIAKLPGRRALAAFNAQSVDGELFRLQVIEKHYKVPFVRSQHPVLQITQGVWIRNGHELRAASIIGYVIGRRWQEDFAGAQPQSYRLIEYSLSKEMFADFNAGRLDGFLSSSENIDPLLESKVLNGRPILAVKTGDRPLYHYLHEDYAPFMAEFSKLLQD